MPVRGDFSSLRQLGARLGQLKRAEFRKHANAAMGETARNLAVECFRQSRSPFGQVWPALKSRNGKPLVDSGRLMRSIKYSATSKQFSLHTNVAYAQAHNSGLAFVAGKRRIVLPERRFMPDATTGIGPIWGKRFEREAEHLLRDVFK